MMLLNSIRGTHSTGLFGVEVPFNRETDKVSWIKKIGSPYALFAESDAKRFQGKMFRDFHAVIAHGRYATTGQVTAQNAHPFHYGHIVLVHNGTLRNLHEFELDGAKVDKMVDVDSAGIAVLLNTMTIDEIVKKLRGAFALVWYDRRTKRMYALRNTERPLYMVSRKNEPGIYFSSEKPVFNYIESKYDIKLDEVIDLEPGTLYTFPLGTGATAVWEEEKLELHKWPTSTHYSASEWGNYNYGAHHQQQHDYTNFKDKVWRNGRWWPKDAPENAVKVAPKGTKEEEEEFYKTHTWNTTFGAWIPKTTEAGEAVIKEFTFLGKRYKRGDWHGFWVQDIKEIGSDKIALIRGVSTDCDRVEVVLHRKADDNPVTVGDMWAGRIRRINYIDNGEGQDSTLRLSLEFLQAVTAENEDKILAGNEPVDFNSVYAGIDQLIASLEKKSDESSNAFVPLKNGDSISLEKFNHLAGKGCAKCGNRKLEVTDAAFCLVVADNPAATPKEKSHAGIYCPSCSTSIVN